MVQLDCRAHGLLQACVTTNIISLRKAGGLLSSQLCINLLIGVRAGSHCRQIMLLEFGRISNILELSSNTIVSMGPEDEI